MAQVALAAALVAALAGWALTVRLFLIDTRESRETASGERERHAKQLAELHQARMSEVANLLQRIQAPETAVAVQAARDAPPDPVHPDISSDQELFDYYQHKMADLSAQGAVAVAVNGESE